jgi:hypothetical protein
MNQKLIIPLFIVLTSTGFLRAQTDSQQPKSFSLKEATDYALTHNCA